MPATTIHFVRHGKVENPGHLLYERLPGFHLSDVGVRMARPPRITSRSARQLNTVSAVYSSPLERTRETAGEILESLNSVRGLRGEEPLELQTDERLIEARNEFRGKRIGFGEGALWKNGNWKLVRNLWKPSWGESYQSIAHRMAGLRPGESGGISRQTDRGGQPRIADLELPAHAGNGAPRTQHAVAPHRARFYHLHHLRLQYRENNVHYVRRSGGGRRIM